MRCRDFLARAGGAVLSVPSNPCIAVNLDRPARAFRMLRLASVMLALLGFVAVVAIFLQEIHAPSGKITANTVLVVSAIAIFLITPLTWFAINGMQPLFLVPIAGFFVWMIIAYHDYMQRSGASYGTDTIFEMVVSLFPLGVMLWAALRGLLLTRTDRAITRPLDKGAGYLTVLRFAFGVWPGLRRSLVQTGISTVLLYISQIIQGVSIVALGAIILIAVRDAGDIFNPNITSSASTSDRIYDAAILPLLALVATVALLLISAGLRNTSRWVSRQSYERQVGRDLRPPILFLRAFKDDQSRLPQSGILHRLLRAELGARRLDHILVEEFSRFGPVVALGRPGERMRPFGAARVYVEHSDWQAKVLELTAKAAHIVLVADDSAGIAWEIDTMLDPVLRAKTIFLATEPLGDLRACAPLHTLIRAQGIATSDRIIGAFQSHEDHSLVLHATRPLPEIYIVALQAFFRRDQITVV